MTKSRRKRGQEAAIREVAPIEPEAQGAHEAQDDLDGHLRSVVGYQVRSLRVRKKMSAKDLAASAKISVAMLSRLEHGTVTPSLHTLGSLAIALGVPLSELLKNIDDLGGASHIKAGQGIKVERTGSKTGQLYESLGRYMEGPVQMEPCLITIDSKSQPYSSFQHEGVEFIYMLEGDMVYRHGTREFRLEPGDTLFFDASKMHGPVSFESIPTKFLSVISYQRH